MDAASIMSRDVKWLPPSACVSDAIHLMRDEGIRHVPVIDGGHLVGMLDESDVRELALAAVLAPDRETRDMRLAQSVGPVVSDDVVTVPPHMDVRAVVDTLVETRAGAVVVVDEQERRVVGLISVIDALRALRHLG